MKRLSIVFGIILALVMAVPVAATSTDLVTVSWQLPAGVVPNVTIGDIGAVPSNFDAIFPQTFVAQDSGSGLGNSDLLPEQCGVYVQEDVYDIAPEGAADLLASLEANGLALKNGTPGDSTILVSGQFVFAYTGDCATPSPSESPSASPSESPSASPSTSPSTSPSVTPSVTPVVTPHVTATPSLPATDTQGPSDPANNAWVFLAIAIAAAGAVVLIVTKPLRK